MAKLDTTELKKVLLEADATGRNRTILVDPLSDMLVAIDAGAKTIPQMPKSVAIKSEAFSAAQLAYLKRCDLLFDDAVDSDGDDDE